MTALGQETSLATWLMIAGLIAWAAFYFMDVGWYHRLLVGAVTKGLALEKDLKTQIPGIDLAEAIGDASPITIIRWKKKPYVRLHSNHKAHVFYWLGILIILAFIVVAHYSGNAPTKHDRGVGIFPCRLKPRAYPPGALVPVPTQRPRGPQRGLLLVDLY